MPTFLTNILIALLGWVCGAFVNFASDVLPYKRKLVQPFCLECQQPFSPVNYFLLPRRCPECNEPRSWRTWVVELVFVIAALLTWYYPSQILGFWLGMVVLVFFGVIVVIDMEHRAILQQVSLVGAVLGVVVGVLCFGTDLLSTVDLGEGPFLTLQPHTLPYGIVKTAIGGIAGFGIMLLFFFTGNLFARTLGKLRGEVVEEEALGYGDVYLSGILGLMLTWDRIIFALFFGVLIGGVFSLLYLIVKTLMRKYQLFTAIPYGPFLVAGAVVILFF